MRSGASGSIGSVVPPMSESVGELAAQFRRFGYAVDRDVVTGVELASLRRETAAMIAADRRVPPGDFQVRDGRPWKIDFPSDPAKQEYNDSIGIVTAHPRITSVITAIIGASHTLVNTILTFKHSGGGAVVPRHRDDFPDRIEFSQGHIVMSADIYLDDSSTANGCLYVIPGSQIVNDVSDLVAMPMTATADMVPVEMRAGDILYHDALLVHGSKSTPPGDNMRRVLYAVYTSPDMLISEGILATLPVPPRWWVSSVVSQAAHWARRRSDVYGDSRYEIPASWQSEVERTEPNLRPDPTWIAEESREELRVRFNRLSRNEFAAGQVEST